MLQYIIVCPLVFLAGLVDSIAGGGGLISLPAYLIARVPPHMVLGTNKLGSFMGTSISTIRFAKNGFIWWKVALCSGAMALISSTAGSNLALLVSEKVITHMMIVILPIVAFYVLRDKNMGRARGEGTRSEGQILLISMAAGLAVGMYDGFYGPGTGTFLLLILTGAAGLDVKNATGITKVINLSSNASALVTFVVNGKVNYSLGLAAGLCCIAGNYIGSGMVVSNGHKVVKPVILFVLAILFVTVLTGKPGVSM